MKSISFPKIFSKNTTLIKEGDDAILQNLRLLLLSEAGGFKGDPYFGVNLKRYQYDQNNYILRDILIDEIYTQIAIFMPQLIVERRNIEIIQEYDTCYVKITARNQIDFTTNMYQLALFKEEGR